MTIRDLIKIAVDKGYSMNTTIYPLGADVKYIKFTRDTNGNEAVILDECQIDDEIEEEENMRVELFNERVGRGYLVQAYKRDEYYGICKYDIELAYGGRYILTFSRGCVGEKSMKYNFDVAVRVMRRIIFLLDSLHIAQYNKMKYSTDTTADIARDGMLDEWNEENEKIKMLERWVDDTMKYYGEYDERYMKLKSEFGR